MLWSWNGFFLIVVTYWYHWRIQKFNNVRDKKVLDNIRKFGYTVTQQTKKETCKSLIWLHNRLSKFNPLELQGLFRKKQNPCDFKGIARRLAATPVEDRNPLILQAFVSPWKYWVPAKCLILQRFRSGQKPQWFQALANPPKSLGNLKIGVFNKKR